MSFDRNIIRIDTGIVVDFTHAKPQKQRTWAQVLAAMSAIESGSMATSARDVKSVTTGCAPQAKRPMNTIAQAIRDTVERILHLQVDHCDTVH